MHWDTGGREHTGICPGFPRSAVKSAICQGSTAALPEWGFPQRRVYPGVFPPPSGSCLPGPRSHQWSHPASWYKAQASFQAQKHHKEQFSLLSADFFHAFFPTRETSLKLDERPRRSPFAFLNNFPLSRGEFGLSEHPEM